LHSTIENNAMLKLRVLPCLIPAVIIPLIFAACNGTDSTDPGPTLVWTSVASPATQRLYGVWGSSASDVWAVGFETVIHYDGATWSSPTSVNATGKVFRGVWGTSASNVWAAGYDYTASFPAMISHYNGTSWSTVPSGTINALLGIWGSSASDVWAVGDAGAIVHYDGTNWSSVPTVASAANDYLDAVWGSSRSDVWAAGGNSLYHYNGTAWSAVSGPGGSHAIWGTSPSDVWTAAGSDTFHYNGSAWSMVPTGRSLPEAPSSIWGTSPSNVWAVTTSGSPGICCGGAILHYNGAAWSNVMATSAKNLTTVWGSSSSDVWAVGESGTILHGTPAG
jgi:hypothetical protein